MFRKIIVKRTENYMDRIVSPNQTSFYPRRNIHENIVMAQVILHSMHKLKGKKGFFVIKVDLAKAKLCGLITGAITVVKMRVLWNGDEGD